jgi:hypothetical protein
MTDMNIVSIGSLEFISTAPMTRNKKGLLIQHPYFAITDDGNEYHFNGRDVMWSFLDALFPDDPLPRNAVEDDLYAPDEYSPSMWQLFNDFTYEAFQEGNDYLVLYHTKGVVSMVQSLKAVSLSNDIERAGTLLVSMLDEEACYSVVKYRDKHGSHLRRTVSVYHEGLAYEVIDLGTRWYLRVIGEPSVCIMPPRTVLKTADNELKSALAKARAEAIIFIPPTGDLKPLPTMSSVLTREYDMLRWERYGGSA